MVESVHCMFTYDQPAEFATTTGMFIREGLEAGERALVLADLPKIEWIKDELGPDANEVHFIDARVAYEPLTTSTRLAMDFMVGDADRAPGGRIVAERPAGKLTPPQIRHYFRLDAAANVGLAPTGVHLLCPYDTSATDTEILDLCRRAHPEVLTKAGREPSLEYEDPRAFIREHTDVAAIPANAEKYWVDRVEDLPAARNFIRLHGREAGLSKSRMEDLTLAVNELMSNALLHGKTPRCVSAFVRDGMLVYDVHDSGPGPDPLQAYLPPRPDLPRSRGLWIAQLTCDAIEFGSGPDGAHVQAVAVL